MKKKILTSLFIVFLVFGCIFVPNLNIQQVYADVQTSAKAMCVIETTSKRVLYSKNPDEKLANASTTKIATFLTVLKNCRDFDKEITVDDRAIGIEGTSIYLKPKERLTIKQLLFGMMLPSGNDAATALALAISPSIEDFAKLMTNEAKSVGASNTNFKNPHGLDEEGHYTTAYDLALITAECYKYEVFKEVVTTKNIKIPNVTGYRYLKNKNKLLNTLEGCVGVKTGFTNDAGRCLVSSAIRDNMQVVCVVLNCGPMFEESYGLIESAFGSYHMTDIIAPYTYLRSIPVINSMQKQAKLYIQKGFSYPLTIEEKVYINIEAHIPSQINAPIEKEESVGELKIYLNKNLLFSEKIYTMEEIKSNKVEDNLKRFISNW